MSNAYVDLTTLKSSGVLNIAGTGDDTRLRHLVEAISRASDKHVKFPFFPHVATLHFSGENTPKLFLPRYLVSVTSLKEDADGDATYEDTWASTDYVLAPHDADPANTDPDMVSPYWMLEVDGRSQGTKRHFSKGQKQFELTGIWGYCESLKASGATVSGAHNATVTTLAVSSGAAFKVLETIKVGSEYLYITAISSNDLTVERRVSGSTPAAISSGAAISIVQYPSPVREAVIMEVSRHWVMKASGFASRVGNADTGEVQVFNGALSPAAMSKLDEFKRRVLV